jgi:hypothetical protein
MVAKPLQVSSAGALLKPLRMAQHCLNVASLQVCNYRGCGTRFCYQCGKQYKSNDHFSCCNPATGAAVLHRHLPVNWLMKITKQTVWDLHAVYPLAVLHMCLGSGAYCACLDTGPYAR